ncbi:inward rectifier potassium channel [Methylocapsa palsarum]|uniref:Inward rectifier potassium channel n=2 Tax=Methylocapsa palsarum TaxID=1612308 RepID=A0A1I3XIX5_9HYPH|nr:inward rectifier potassium channel [Methylocapsa palsarum]
MRSGQDRRGERGAMRIGSFGESVVIKRGVSKYDLRDPYHVAIDLSWKEFGLLFIGAEIAINLVFAFLYMINPGCIANARPGAFSDAFFFSIETLATVGYGFMAPATFYGHAVSAIEIVTGMAFTAIMTGLLFVRFSRPRAKIIFADRAVIATHNGAPTLMLRIANGRFTLLTGASAQLGVLLHETSAEGQSFRRLNYLTLLTPSIALFPLTWTLMHVIDSSSPLHGRDAQDLAKNDAQLFLTLEARDAALGASVHDVRTYGHADLLFGMRYADAVSVDEKGRTIADLSRLSLVEPDLAAQV